MRRVFQCNAHQIAFCVFTYVQSLSLYSESAENIFHMCLKFVNTRFIVFFYPRIVFSFSCKPHTQVEFFAVSRHVVVAKFGSIVMIAVSKLKETQIFDFSIEVSFNVFQSSE